MSDFLHNPPHEKRWRLYILPQYLANLTQPVKAQRKPNFYNICPCMKDILYARFEDFVTLLYVFTNVNFFVRSELWVNVPIVIFFPTEDC